MSRYYSSIYLRARTCRTRSMTHADTWSRECIWDVADQNAKVFAPFMAELREIVGKDKVKMCQAADDTGLKIKTSTKKK
jgi:hypothetical protein